VLIGLKVQPETQSALPDFEVSQGRSSRLAASLEGSIYILDHTTN